MHPTQRIVALVFLGAAMSFYPAALVSAAAPASTSPAGGLHERIVAQYMSGKWDELSADLAAGGKEIAALPPSQKADIDYIRKTVAECRPAWWKLIKSGKKIKFRPVVWIQPLNATFDPEQKNNVHLNFVNGLASVIVNWTAADMDNPAVDGELEFSKGEHIEVELWTNLGIAQSWEAVPPHAQLNMNEEARAQLSRYLDFRGNLTGAYYAGPRARRWAIWLSISGWSDEYAKISTVMSRKAIGVFFAAEVLGHPRNYPSIKRPEEPPADGAESKMIWALQDWIRHNNLTFAEDRALRDAMKAFAAANEAKTRLSGKIVLSNGLSMALDPAADKPLCAQRDAWIKAQYQNGN